MDHVASLDAGDRDIALISCTASPDLSKKIGNLTTQRTRGGQKVPGSSVNAAIFAPVDPGEVSPGDNQACLDQNISLVLRPQIQSLFDLLTAGMQSQAIETLRKTVFRSAFIP